MTINNLYGKNGGNESNIRLSIHTFIKKNKEKMTKISNQRNNQGNMTSQRLY